MHRGFILAWLCLALPLVAATQEPGTVRISVVLTGADGVPMPIRRHLLLISDNPASAPPRRVFTSADGTVDLTLRAGSYTVESDQPVALGGASYQWTLTIDVVAGRQTVLALTPANADVGSATAAPGAPSALDEDRRSLVTRWQGSVVEVWTPTAHASGAVVDAAGLVVTTHGPIGRATIVSVQLSPTRKVAGQVVVSDAERDLAVLRIDPATAAAVTPLPLDCASAGVSPAIGDEIVALEAPLGHPKGATSGTVSRVATRVIESDIAPGPGGSGGPVFSTRGAVLGLTSEGDARMRAAGADPRVVRTSEVCAVLSLARTTIAGAAPPGTALPVEPATPYPTAGLRDADTLLARHPPFMAASSGFEVAFLTPVHVWAGQRMATRGRSMQIGDAWLRARMATEFENWSDYVEAVPAVLFIRVTPKLVESVWMKLVRGAAFTQGVALPPLKRLSAGFLRLRAFCGGQEVTPIHPFVLEVAAGDETIAEGLYAFAPDALSPACGAVRLELFSQKEPTKADPLVVDPKILEQVWMDFAAHRGQP